MSEYPILFKPKMVQAILDGRKSQTRRVMKPQPPSEGEVKIHIPKPVYGDWPIGHMYKAPAGTHKAKLNPFAAVSVKDDRWDTWLGIKPAEFEWISPYGKPGDALWVRETYAVTERYDDYRPSDVPEGTQVWYQAGGKRYESFTDDVWRGKRRPSIYMCRWMSRLTLEITDVRVERVCHISPQDAASEGVPVLSGATGSPDSLTAGLLVDQFRQLWDEINLERGYPWKDNPWVWVIKFEKVDE